MSQVNFCVPTSSPIRKEGHFYLEKYTEYMMVFTIYCIVSAWATTTKRSSCDRYDDEHHNRTSLKQPLVECSHLRPGENELKYHRHILHNTMITEAPPSVTLTSCQPYNEAAALSFRIHHHTCSSTGGCVRRKTYRDNDRTY